jgi:hypothetical protein
MSDIAITVKQPFSKAQVALFVTTLIALAGEYGYKISPDLANQLPDMAFGVLTVGSAIVTGIIHHYEKKQVLVETQGPVTVQSAAPAAVVMEPKQETP